MTSHYRTVLHVTPPCILYHNTLYSVLCYVLCCAVLCCCGVIWQASAVRQGNGEGGAGQLDEWGFNVDGHKVAMHTMDTTCMTCADYCFSVCLSLCSYTSLFDFFLLSSHSAFLHFLLHFLLCSSSLSLTFLSCLSMHSMSRTRTDTGVRIVHIISHTTHVFSHHITPFFPSLSILSILYPVTGNWVLRWRCLRWWWRGRRKNRHERCKLRWTRIEK